jgi:hypothetical protein
VTYLRLVEKCVERVDADDAGDPTGKVDDVLDQLPMGVKRIRLADCEILRLIVAGGWRRDSLGHVSGALRDERGHWSRSMVRYTYKNRFSGAAAIIDAWAQLAR